MDILSAAKKRHTAKAYDSERRISEEVMQQVYDLLRNSASSVNSQPWHFIVANTPEGRARIAKATQGGYVYNAAKVNDASHVIVLCARVDMDEAHLDALLEPEDRDGRFRDAQARTGQDATRRGYVTQHRYGTTDVAQWLEKQVYLALVLLTNRLLSPTVSRLPERCRQTFLCSSLQPLILVLLAWGQLAQQCKFLDH